MKRLKLKKGQPLRRMTQELLTLHAAQGEGIVKLYGYCIDKEKDEYMIVRRQDKQAHTRSGHTTDGREPLFSPDMSLSSLLCSALLLHVAVVCRCWVEAIRRWSSCCWIGPFLSRASSYCS